MASDKQVSANRQNAAKSTGPITQNGKLQSRRNALRHGLTAATVVPAIEDTEEFERFAAAVKSDYQAASTVEHELVARLTSLLWRLRRSTLIETNLFQLQARLAQDQKEAAQVGPDTTKPGIEVFYRLLRGPDSAVPSQAPSNTPEFVNHGVDVANARESSESQRQSSCGSAISTASRSSGLIATRPLCGDKWPKRCSFLMHARSECLLHSPRTPRPDHKLGSSRKFLRAGLEQRK